MKVRIKNMVSLRCKLKVASVLEELGVAYTTLELGELQFAKPLSKPLKRKLKEELSKSGLELIYDRNALLIDKIVNVVVVMVKYTEELPEISFSTYLSDKLKLDYNKMAVLFSSSKGITLEHFVILHKVERVKELIICNTLNLTEISFKMQYSGVAHLSKQFKQITGITPTFYKLMSDQERSDLNKAGWLYS
ncbi:helix-turn-helix protein [Leeuwenhoekiella aestuarii]|uniref:Helix-turn-helix protein n=1 Tax=Leeuwenhoekiella aestuarii TaxID=2249426 RepID=A0A4Q0NUU1_9FLAO|nr:helix-turn-helix domain-containing protein [Leeuwenhoekiella aestuarii]RXG11637.1 helix-turn-helix protein [Leeuwenhoekiella aestuarii]RXG15152.1 helix-turn-helix protein [Leeuwenhoekiella aestuarii]